MTTEEIFADLMHEHNLRAIREEIQRIVTRNRILEHIIQTLYSCRRTKSCGCVAHDHIGLNYPDILEEILDK